MLLYYCINNLPLSLCTKQGIEIKISRLNLPIFLDGQTIFQDCSYLMQGVFTTGSIALNPQNSNSDHKVLIFDDKTYSKTKTEKFSSQSSIVVIPSNILQRLENSSLPGMCGFLLTERINSDAILQERNYKLRKIITQYAQARLKIKGQKMFDSVTSFSKDNKDNIDIEQLLYSKIFRAMGYKKFHQVFESLAAALPYSWIKQYQNDNGFFPTDKLLAYWLGKANLFDTIPKNIFTVAKISELKKEWKKFDQAPFGISPSLKGIRPLGHPVRRLLGMLQLLSNVHKEGLFATWLAVLNQTKNFSFSDWQKQLSIIYLISPLFEVVKEVKYLNVRLTGQDRLSIIMVDAVLPFFLLLSANLKNKQLQRLLFKIYYTFPRERTLNSLVKEMEQRLAKTKINKTMYNSLAYSQGMLQFSKELCLTFEDGCKNCLLKQWLE